MPVDIRPGRLADASRVHAILAHNVDTGTASFSLEAPGPDEVEARLARMIDQDLPFHVATSDGRLIGYAWADWFRPRPGYRFTLEDSIYVEDGHQGRGVGKRLLNGVIESAQAGGYKQMIAVIGDIENTGSIGVHKACGFQYCGVLKDVGFKFDRWLDTIYMQRAL